MGEKARLVVMKRFATLVLFVATVMQANILAVKPASASFIGDTITATWLTHPPDPPGHEPISVVVGDGIEFSGTFVNPVTLDFGANFINIISPGNVGWGVPGQDPNDGQIIEFSGFSDTITGISVSYSYGFHWDIAPTFIILSFSPHSIFMQVTPGAIGGDTPWEECRLTYDISTVPSSSGDPVPEPATMLLMGTGLAGFVATRRRKRA